MCVNIKRDFKSPNRLHGLDEYYFTAFESAIEFIENIDESKIKISKVEYERYINDNTRRA